MKILLFGKNGQVGWELHRSLQPLGEVIALGREEADFSEPESLRKIIQEVKPDVIVNAVAYTAVDKAEEEEELAATVNGRAPGVLAEEAKQTNALLVHYSTDYVFDGIKHESYIETDKPNPINAYGRTKLAGERAIQECGCDYLIMRTSWVYSSRGHNFLFSILRLAGEREQLRIVNDQIGSPTSARLIAETSVLCIHRVVQQKQEGVFSPGLYHLVSSGKTSWHGFAKQIIAIVDMKPGIRLKLKALQGITSADYPTPARRPMNSQLSTGNLQTDFRICLPHWKSVLELCMGELNYDRLYFD